MWNLSRIHLSMLDFLLTNCDICDVPWFWNHEIYCIPLWNTLGVLMTTSLCNRLALATVNWVLENSRAGENTRLHLGFSLICSWTLPNSRPHFHQAMKARKICFFYFFYKLLFSVLTKRKTILLTLDNDVLEHKTQTYLSQKLHVKKTKLKRLTFERSFEIISELSRFTRVEVKEF